MLVFFFLNFRQVSWEERTTSKYCFSIHTSTQPFITKIRFLGKRCILSEVLFSACHSMSSCMVSRSSSWLGESFDPLRLRGTTVLWSRIPHLISDKSSVVLGRVQFCTFKLWVWIGKAWLEVVMILLGWSVIWVMVCPGMFCPETNRFDIPVTWLAGCMFCHIGFCCCCWVCVVE